MTTPPQDPFGTQPEPGPAQGPGYSPGPGYSQGPGYAQAYGPAPTAYGPPPGPYGGTETRTEPKAIVALVLAVLAWTPTVPFIGAIAALVLARMARRDIHASGGRLTGLGLCTWATVLSWVHLVVLGLVLLVALLLFVVPFAVSS